MCVLGAPSLMGAMTVALLLGLVGRTSTGTALCTVILLSRDLLREATAVAAGADLVSEVSIVAARDRVVRLVGGGRAFSFSGLFVALLPLFLVGSSGSGASICLTARDRVTRVVVAVLQTFLVRFPLPFFSWGRGSETPMVNKQQGSVLLRQDCRP